MVNDRSRNVGKLEIFKLILRFFREVKKRESLVEMKI